jgi:dolichyl-diphosphooligosaccharide--protein glycosyltransferase
VRLLPLDYLLGTVQPIVSGTDPWYSVRQVEQILYNFPNFAWFDPFLSYPQGKVVDWGPVFPLFLSIFAFIGNAHTQGEIIQTISLIPPLLGILLIPLCFILGTIIWDVRVGWISAMLISVVGGETLYRSFYGNVDHHIMEVLLTTCFFICYFSILSRFTGKRDEISGKNSSNSIKMSIRHLLINLNILNNEFFYAIIAGFLYYLAIMTIPTCTLIALSVFLISFFLTIVFQQKSDYLRLLIINCIIFGIFMILFFINGVNVSGYSFSQYTVIHLLIPLVIILESFILFFFSYSLKKQNPFIYMGILLGFFGFLSVLIATFAPTIIDSFISILYAFFGGGGTSITIQEMQSFNPILLIKNFNFAAIFGIFGFFLVIYQFHRFKNPVLVGVIVWIVVYSGLSLMIARYFYYEGEIIVILTAVFLIVLFDKVQGKISSSSTKSKEQSIMNILSRNKNGILVIGTLILIITGLSITSAMQVAITETPKQSINDEWILSLQWLAKLSSNENMDYYATFSKETYKYPSNVYTILSWWGSGHWILAFTHNIPATSPFQDNIVPVAMFLLSESDVQAEKYASELHSKFIITTNKDLFDSFPMIQKWLPDTPDIDPYYFVFYNRANKNSQILAPMLGMRPSFFNTTLVKLHVNDGSFIPANTSVIVSYRITTIENQEVPVMKNLLPLNQSQTLVFLSQKQQNQEVVSLKYTSPITDTPALKNYRLIYESNGTRTFPGDVTLNNIKIFERVKGYTIPGTGTIEVPIVTNQGRHFTYRQQSENGTFTLPYATTNSPYDVQATGPYRIIETNKTFDVDESQIEKFYT